ncbi:poly(A)-specific ribonuclease PARN, putative [Plasmodium chabaudi chabaudi]|uniref:Poly(A)-specific ribonuclease PARN, putative n=1 Tax=Plasmodium chabaudi chabaudi TaxID=31271 RepID=A0A4V0KCI1_PLACU|nr:poly(A)-specific ribonuclease PARN, putative [Plasmodium chabaudi chabaudi]VTZ70056.1 poly(A)-specific ribonuclease PARN, putative [Plasmodium chabaudi chabaudi]|eukprot:XP_016654457.1 poly(A)-specific ribonuclease PARN, putative [Plasmodium chabaudi chabaudi]
MLSVTNYFFKNVVLKEKTRFMKYNILKRAYSRITSVNINNWNNIHKEILSKIQESDFVSIDVEYTGLHLKDERYISIDSSYEAHCYGAKSFFPCQIGITIAKKKEITTHDKCNEIKNNMIKNKNIHNIKVFENNDKTNNVSPMKNEQEWDISPYCIYIFPKENKYFSVSTSTLIFLKENNFDFNEWIFNGVSYLRPNEEDEKKKHIFEKIDGLKNLLNKCNTKKDYNKETEENKIDINKIINEIENYKAVDDEDKQAVIEIVKKIGIWLSNENETQFNNTAKDELKDASLSNSCYKGVDYKNSISETFIANDKNLDNSHKSVHNSTEGDEKYSENSKDLNYGNNVEYDKCPLYIEIENPYLRLLAHTLITKYFNSIFCISVKLNDKKNLAIYKTEKDSYNEQIKALQMEIEKINETIGVRLLFDEIIKSNKILIGHNCFYDILHIYQTFYHELPDSIHAFKRKWTELFPYTIDTKYMNETNEYLYSLNGPATLKGLCEYMASLISSSKDFDFFFNFLNGNVIDLQQCLIPFVKDEKSAANLSGENYNERQPHGAKNDNNDENIGVEGKENDKNQLENNTPYKDDEKSYKDTNTLNDNANALKSDEHNAGYDSLLTCLLFIFQCHYILKKNNLSWKNIYFTNTNIVNENKKHFLDIFSNMCNKIKIVKTQPNVVSLTSSENYEMARHFYMYDYPSYFKKWEIMKIWSPIWITLSKVDDQSCWVIAKSDDDAKNIKMIYKMLQNPQFKLCTYEEYLNKFKSK